MAKLSLNSACTCQGNFACLYFVKEHFLWGKISFIKDGASFCNCAYVRHISGYSGFLTLSLPRVPKIKIQDESQNLF